MATGKSPQVQTWFLSMVENNTKKKKHQSFVIHISIQP